MKTLEFVRGLIQTNKLPDDIEERLQREYAKSDIKKRDKLIAKALKKEKKRISVFRKFLIDAVAYLESSPRLEFIHKTLDSLHKQEDKIHDNLEQWVKSCGGPDHKDKNATQLKSIYYKEMGLKKIKDQIKFLNFILK